MSDLRVFADQRGVARSADDRWVALRATRDGAPIVVPWYQALVMEGKVYQAAAAGANMFTGITLLAFGSFAETAKSIFVDVPDGTAAIPLECYFNFLATGAAIVHGASFTSGTLNGTGGTETAITIQNLFMGGAASGCTAAHTASSETDNMDGTEIVLCRLSTSQDLDGVGIDPRMIFRASESPYTPVLLDAASINTIASPTTSGTGMGHITWAEFTESDFS